MDPPHSPKPTAKVFTYQITEDQYELYRNYAMWNSLQPQYGFYSQIPAYQQLNLSTQVPSALYSPTTSSESDQNEKIFFTLESTKDFKLNCEHCGSIYKSRKRLQNHYEKCNVLNAGSVNIIACKICSKTFKTNTGYTNHMVKFHSEEKMKSSPEKHENLNRNEAHQEKSKSIFHSIDMLAKSDA